MARQRPYGSLHICFPSTVILRAKLLRGSELSGVFFLFVCLFSRKKGHALFIRLPTHIAHWREVQLTCLVVVLLLRHSSGGLSSGEDPSPSPRPQPCACVSGSGMASAGRRWQRFKTASSSLCSAKWMAPGWWCWILYLLSQSFFFLLISS